MTKHNNQDMENSPFAVLKKIHVKEKGTSLANNDKKSSVKEVHTTLGKNSIDDSFSEDDENSLFLSAMQSVQASSQKEVKHLSDPSMSEVFARLGKKDNQNKNNNVLTQNEKVLESKKYLQKSEHESSNKSQESDLFSQAMGGVIPVKGKGRAVAKPPEKLETKAPRPVDIMQQLLDGNIEFSLHNTGEYIEGHVVGVDPIVIEQLRSGSLSPEAHIDLHGQNAEQAYETLSHFLKHAYQKNMRTVIVVTGRGKNSPSGIGVIRSMVPLWLTKNPFKRAVLGFCSARPHDGGAGALYVLLRKYKKSRGKIMWDLPYDGSIDSLA